MKKLYILRGHQGSGKSTYAKKIINDNKENTDIVLEFNNDDYIVRKFGEYLWTPQNIDEAVKETKRALYKNIEDNKGNKDNDIILISSNMNTKSNLVCEMATKALKNGFEVDIVTFKNFYKNEHNVSDADVINTSMAIDYESKRIDDFFIRFFETKENEKKYKNKLNIYSYRNSDLSLENIEYENQIKEKVNTLKNLDLNNLPYDSEKNTYITKQFLEYGRMTKLFIETKSKKYPNLRVLKYANKVFFDNLFNEALLEMRGIVLDDNDEIVIRPFKKIFNYSERVANNSKYPITIHDDHKVKLVHKLNGFLGVVTYVTKMNEVLYSTTGSLDSDFAEMNKRHTEKYKQMFLDYPNTTFLFEILDENDPHIIKEKIGEVLIGAIDVKTGKMYSEEHLNEIGLKYSIRRPDIIHCTFGECKELLKTVQHEGFMVYSDEAKDGHNKNELMFKMKSPYYLISKLFGRMKDEKLEKILDKKNIDEEYYEVVDFIKQNLEVFKNLENQDRIKMITEFLDDKYYALEKKSNIKTKIDLKLKNKNQFQNNNFD